MSVLSTMSSGACGITFGVQAPAGFWNTSGFFTYQRLFKDTYFISEPQINFPKGPLFCARAMTDSARWSLARRLAEGGGTQIRHVDVSAYYGAFLKKI